MKTRKKIMAFGLCTLMLLGGIVSTYAASVVNGSSYQTVEYINIPGGGRWKFNTSDGSKKMNSTTLATFKKTYGQAALGNYGTLVTNTTGSVSEEQGLAANKPTWLSEHGAKKGGTYYSGIASHDYEPSNSCDVTLKFSADTLELPN